MEEIKMSFLKKFKTSIFGLEDYQKLAMQKTGKTIAYLAKLIIIIVFILSIIITYRFGKNLKNVKNYIENEISEIKFENGVLNIIPKNNEHIEIKENETINGMIVVNTKDISTEKIEEYSKKLKEYQNGIIVLKDKIIIKNAVFAIPTTISLIDIANKYNIVNVEKQDILKNMTGTQVYIAVFIGIFIYLFIIIFSTTLIDALLYSMFAYLTGIVSKLNLKYTACYNIAIYSLTLPIVLNFIYVIVNIFNKFTIRYFDIMYMAITCIYVITAVLMIKTDVIKKHIELSKIISEQEKIRQEMENAEQQKKEEEERQKVRKKDKEKEKENKDGTKDKTSKKQKETKNNNGAQPQANIKENN